MEYVQNLLSAFSDSQTLPEDSSTASPSSSHLPPPDFLSLVRRSSSRRSRQITQATPTGKETLTPLELKLRDLVVDLYSDQQTSSKSSQSPLESEDQSEFDSGTFSDRPTTSFSDLILSSSSPFPLPSSSPFPLSSSSATMVEPRTATPLRSYNSRELLLDKKGDTQLIPSFSADDIANEDQEDPSLHDNNLSSKFKFGSSVVNPANFPSSSPYGMKSSLSHDSQAPPPNSIPIYSYTEPSLTFDPKPKVSSSDLRSLVSKSFQLPPQQFPSHLSQHKKTTAENNSSPATPTSTMTTPTSTSTASHYHQEATPTQQETTPTNQLTAIQTETHHEAPFVPPPPPSPPPHPSPPRQPSVPDTVMETIAVLDQPPRVENDELLTTNEVVQTSTSVGGFGGDTIDGEEINGGGGDGGRGGGSSGSSGPDNEGTTALVDQTIQPQSTIDHGSRHHHHLVGIQSPLSPKDVRDRLAELAHGTPLTPQASTPTRLHPLTPQASTPTQLHPLTPPMSTPPRLHPLTPQASTPTQLHPLTPPMSTPPRLHPLTPQASTPTQLHPLTPPVSYQPTKTLSLPQNEEEEKRDDEEEEEERDDEEEEEEEEDEEEKKEQLVKEKEILELHNFDDTETSSVVSLDQITEALRQEPLPLSLPTSRQITTPDGSHHAFSLPLSSSPRPPQTASLPSRYTKNETTAPTSVNMPQHLKLSHKPQIPNHPPAPPAQSIPLTNTTTTKPISSVPPSPSSSSEQRLSEVLHAQAHLQGQLEAVSQECQELLQERASLSSKLAVAETELELAKRERRPYPTDGVPQREEEDTRGELRGQLIKCRRELEGERQTLATIREELDRVKTNGQQAMAELVDKKNEEEEQARKVKELSEQLRESTRELEEEKVRREEASQQLRSLQTSYGTVEQSKSWMQTQLQEALEGNIKLQEELRASKAELITHSVKVDHMTRENEAFLQQITVLQRGVLQDKARLVSELEAIEADVLHREDSYTQLVAHKTQLEELVQQRSREIDNLSREIGKTRVERDELKSREKEKTEREESLVRQIQSLQKSKTKVEEKLQALEVELAMKEERVGKLERLRLGLQQRLQESETALAGREGDLQKTRDSQDVVRQELELTKEAQRKMERELEEERRRVAMLMTNPRESGEKGEEELVKSLHLLQEGLEVENRSLRERLVEEEKEMREREKELAALRDQRKEERSVIGDLKRRLDTATSEQELLRQTVMERERTIQRLSREKEEDREEVERVLSEISDLQSRLNGTLLQNSRLEGELSEQSSLRELEHLQDAVRERTALKRELEKEKQTHQQEISQSRGRHHQMEMELERVKVEREKIQEQLQNAVQSSEDATRRHTELKSQRQRELEEARRDMEREKKVKEVVEREVERLKSELEETQRQCTWLQREMAETRERLAQESAQKGEVERASGMVAIRLKQNAEGTERKLREDNQTLSLKLEQMKGRLAGITSTLQALKTHASHLEEERAERDSRMTSLQAQVDTLERQKQLREEKVYLDVISAKDEAASLRAELAETCKQLHEEQDQVNELTHQLANTSRQLSEMESVQSFDDKSMVAMEEKMDRLVRGRDDLRLQLTTVNAELVVAKTTAEVAERELQSMKIQSDILQQKLVAMETQYEEVKVEVEEVKEQLRRSEEERESTTIGVGGRRALFETTLSSIGGDEDVDNPVAHHESSCSSYSELHTDQLRELGQQIEKARRQGQEAAEAKTSGEISVLRDQLGSKSRTINSLQSWLVSLRGDMGKLQGKIQSHSATVRASHHTTRQLENQIADLKKSSSLQSPSFLSSPP